MSEIERKVEKYRANLLRVNEMKKGLIDAEISFVSVKDILNLNVYDWRNLFKGELQEKEKEVWELIRKTPENIIKRDGAFKNFQKALIDKGITAKQLSETLGIEINKIYRMLRKINVNRDRELEKKVEQYLGIKVFE